VRVALDPTAEVVARAIEGGQNVVVTHHPAALSMPARLAPGAGPAGVLFAAAASGIALLNAHTNLDRDPAAQRRLPEILGLRPKAPLEGGTTAMAVVTAYVPPEAAADVTAAMSAAGAGRIGDYTACSFSVRGEGRFTVPAAGRPAIGSRGGSEAASEDRVEMVCPADRAFAVVGAARAAHPYEEPLITVTAVEMARNAACLGMVSDAPSAETLGSLAARCAQTFGRVPRVWGAADKPVSRVATSTGSAGSLLSAAASVQADVLVAGEVRYHDAMAAGGVAVIELGHDVSEWPLVTVLADAVREVADLDAATVSVEEPRYGWWTP
jgi:hypothetical protein